MSSSEISYTGVVVLEGGGGGGCQLLHVEFRENHYFSWEIFLFSGTQENE